VLPIKTKKEPQARGGGRRWLRKPRTVHSRGNGSQKIATAPQRTRPERQILDAIRTEEIKFKAKREAPKDRKER
jgi:hypothetical protein